VAAEAPASNGYLHMSPGMLVQFTVFNLMSAASVLVVERRNGALRRLLTTPITRTGIVAGKLLSTFALILAQDLILVAVGHAAFGVPYFDRPLATVAMVVSLSFCMAALGLVVGTFSGSEGAVVAASLILMFALSGLGGAWFPLEGTSPAFAAIGHLVPSAWAMDGFHSIVLRGAGLAGVFAPVGTLLAYGLAFLGLAAWRFRFE
jgi:ABC-2 type transport system permease protein